MHALKIICSYCNCNTLQTCPHRSYGQNIVLSRVWLRYTSRVWLSWIRVNGWVDFACTAESNSACMAESNVACTAESLTFQTEGKKPRVGLKQLPNNAWSLWDVLSGILCGILWHLPLAVEVRHCPLRSGAGGWGPAVPTGIWRRSGTVLAVEAGRRCPAGEEQTYQKKYLVRFSTWSKYPEYDSTWVGVRFLRVGLKSVWAVI